MSVPENLKFATNLLCEKGTILFDIAIPLPCRIETDTKFTRCGIGLFNVECY